METIFEKTSATTGRLTVNVTEADYKPEVDKKIKQYTKTAQVKGFRPGMVPKEYIQKLYGKSILVDEVINLVSKSTNDYITDNNLRVVGDPKPDNELSSKVDWDNSKEFTFAYDLGLASDFTVDLSAIPAVTNYDIEPTEDKVNEAIEDIRRRFGKDEEAEEVEKEDLVFGTLKQEASEIEIKDATISTGRVNEDAFHIFKGLEKGSSVKFDIQSIFANVKDLGYATGKSEEEAAAMAGEFEFTVEKITRVAAADIDQEFFDKALGEGKVSNEEEFRAEIRNIVKENYDRESSYLLDFEVEKTLLNNIHIELPDAFLKDWLLIINEGKFTAEDIDKDYDAFARGLRMDLIRNEVAANNEIKLEYNDIVDEVKAEMRNYFGAYSYEGLEDIIDNMARKTLKENKDNAVRKYTDRAFGKKVREFLKANLTVEKKTVQVDEFNKIAEEVYA
ncbi:trigger factor [Emticicia sp. 21SJ11W-3]|uniref:trigger factor n=1 Tax=Emticicia sp. 21SJ11W-3 TaxID=2916755 RepID=UPI00209CEE95|nr:trigger factor family protein [Emticicia sp. 21SJ11W-3]UTA69595.1 trigger factor family protein [Emticicia sp. 21SJ11W-3]